MYSNRMILAERLLIPADARAILWDMDGVLIDSLGLDYTVCNDLLRRRFGEQVGVDRALVRSLFAYHPPEFWRRILAFVEERFAIANASEALDELVRDYDAVRLDYPFAVNPGIPEILREAPAHGLKLAVVSNNPTADVRTILANVGILEHFDEVIGNDLQSLAKKPAPDTYLYASERLGLEPARCVVVEDSLVGAEAGLSAGCHTIGVATGGADFEDLAGKTNQTYSAFEANRLRLAFGDVKNKNISTPNEFASHMVEHIAWRLCTAIDLHWNNAGWTALGQLLGERIRRFEVLSNSAAALGMIDDGSAEVTIELTDGSPELVLEGIANLDLDWFVGLRCEQLASGRALVELLEGLAAGLGARLAVRVCSVEDAHHAWEGVFRSVGIALNKMFTPRHPQALPVSELVEYEREPSEMQVLARSSHFARVFRGTAESHVIVAVDFSAKQPNAFRFQVAPSIDVSALPRLLERLAAAAGFTLQVEFNATVLSSSHVVLEDTALVLGRALLEMLTLRMQQAGVNGAGSSIQSAVDLANQPIRTGISVEGRKFWKFVPFRDSYETLRKRFLIGQDIYGGLRSEDLDDFLDGLAGGLACSIIVHVQELVPPDEGWPLLFENLGKSLREVFAHNPYRKGVPPGVKATLA